MKDPDALENSRLVLLDAAPSVQIWHDTQASWLYVRWRGPYQPASVQAGWALLVQCLRQQPCTRLLNDARYAAAWVGHEQWVGESLFPKLAEAGVRYVACVYPKALAGRFSLELTLRSTARPFVASFEDLATAYAWLHQWPVAE